VTPRSSRAETTVVVIDDPTLFAESLRTALQLEGYDARWVPAEPARIRHDCAVARADRGRTRIAVLDLDLDAERDALEMLTLLSGVGTRVVVVTASDDPGRWAECLECGAVRVLPKTLPLAEMLAVIERLHDGLPVMSGAERAHLLEEWHRTTSERHEIAARFARLTALEQWVLARLMEGGTVHDMVSAARLPYGLVRGQIRSVLEKLQVVTWLDAVLLANELGWTGPDEGV
jgi:two-component system nitrate/nitrite response regulator NarL